MPGGGAAHGAPCRLWARQREGFLAGGRRVLSSFHLPPLQGPPNFLRASALAEHIKPVVVIPEEAPEDEEPENLIEISTGPPAGEPAVSCPLLAWSIRGDLASTFPSPGLGEWGQGSLCFAVAGGG